MNTNDIHPIDEERAERAFESSQLESIRNRFPIGTTVTVDVPVYQDGYLYEGEFVVSGYAEDELILIHCESGETVHDTGYTHCRHVRYAVAQEDSYRPGNGTRRFRVIDEIDDVMIAENMSRKVAVFLASNLNRKDREER